MTHNTREVEEYGEWDIEVDGVKYAGKRTINQQLQKAREEEGERIYTTISEYRDDVNISNTDFESGFNAGVNTILNYLKEETLDKNNL